MKITIDKRQCGFSVILIALLLSTTTGCQLLQGGSLAESDHLSDLPTVPAILTESWGWAGFLHPTNDEPSQLILLKPYQPGKIPVVFIHGLLSAPGTWQKMIAKLQADSEIDARYQFWVFRYPTGVSYLQSASELRHQLRQTVQELDPNHEDDALSNMVLVGHSMGGLLAKLQVTRSHDLLWKSVSDQPLESLNTDENTRMQIEESLYFEPLPFVRRAVFIATPHQGSRWTEHPLGRLSRTLVEFPESMSSDYQELVDANYNLFKMKPSAAVPTSIDHLVPGNPIISATHQLDVAENVHSHSIIGTRRLLPDLTIGDGVVAETSARLNGVQTELLVSTTHTQIHQHPKTIAEVRCILLLHLRHLQISMSPSRMD